MQQSIFFKEYWGQTVLNPLGLVALIVLGIAMLRVPRRYAAWPLIIMACFIAPAQRIIILTMNFDLLRLMIVFGVLRIVVKEEWRSLRWHKIDTIFVWWSVVGAVVYVIQWSSVDALKWKTGQMYDQLGLYFLARCLIRDMEDIWLLAKGFVILSVPVAAAFLVEHLTAHNLFSIFGGVPEITVVREGRLRCQGAFAHPIIAGCFWATQLPLMAALWWRGERNWAKVGILGSLMIIGLCASSTPVMAVVAVALGGAFFAARRQMKTVCWSVVILLLSLHIVMKAPVWHLIARIDFARGSTGWHRYNLIQQTINHFWEWWLFGARSVEAWGVYGGDVTNQYVIEAVRGGLAGMVLFIVLIVMVFRRVGRLWRYYEQDKAQLMLAWALGVSLFAHVMSFIGVSYFGQIIVVWYLLLGAIVSLAGRVEGLRQGIPLSQAAEAPSPLAETPEEAVGSQRPLDAWTTGIRSDW
jgi:hypothetical protein